MFVPGKFDSAADVARLVEGIGERKISLIAVPGSLAQAELDRARRGAISFGPWSQRVAMTAWADTPAHLLGGARCRPAYG